MSRSDPALSDMETAHYSGCSARSILVDAYNDMDEEEQAFLQSLATDLINMLEDAERAMAKKYADQLFDIEEGCALWSLLPSKVRTAIKRGGK